MVPKPGLTSTTNPIIAQILSRYIHANSMPADDRYADKIYADQLNNVDEICESTKPAENDDNWHNIVCTRCPYFVDGAKTGNSYDYTYVAEKRDTSDSGRTDGDATHIDAASDRLPDKLNVKDAENNDIIGRTENSPWDKEWDELLDGVDAGCDKYQRRRVPIIRCVRPESVECLGESIVIGLIVWRDVIAKQQVLDAMCKRFAHDIVGTDENREQTMQIVNNNVRSRKTLKRNRKLIKAAKKRGR